MLVGSIDRPTDSRVIRRRCRQQRGPGSVLSLSPLCRIVLLGSQFGSILHARLLLEIDLSLRHRASVHKDTTVAVRSFSETRARMPKDVFKVAIPVGDSAEEQEAYRQSMARKTHFGETVIEEPEDEHTHTAIVLHGRGDLGFYADFLDMPTSDGDPIPYKLSGWRWVFPQSKWRWNTVFHELLPGEWFEAWSLTDPTTRQDLQVEGIRESVEHVLKIMDEEIERLGGDARRLVLGGISQGAAIAMWTLLSQRDLKKMPVAVFLSHTWLPFAADIKECFVKHELPQRDESKKPEEDEPRDAVLSMLAPFNYNPQAHGDKPPIFMGHDINDPFVDIELGRQAADVLSAGGYKVEWKEYAEHETEDQHWFAYDEMDDLYKFLERSTSAYEVEAGLEETEPRQ